MTSTNIPVITIDGPSGAGKGTVSCRLAKRLGWHTLDSGALYRVLALAAHLNQISLEDEAALATLATGLTLHFDPLPDLSGTQVFLEGQDVSLSLRSESCGAQASQIAEKPAVREALLYRQRAFRMAPGLVADGRDMGTVVFKEAPLKIFLTASVEERAHRRYNQLISKGIDAKLSNLMIEIAQRDQRDSIRTIAPLMIARDAYVIDTTGVSIEKVVARILSIVQEQF